MNLSDDTINYLERKARLRGLEEARQIVEEAVNPGVGIRKLEDLIELIHWELGPEK